jgi:receptor protein-tyrosine kinase
VQLNELLAVLSKRRWLVLGVLLATVGLATIIAFVQPPRYESTATLALTPKIDPERGFIGSGDLSAFLSTYAETAKSQVTRQRARELLGRPLPGTVDTSTIAGTGILRISARADTPQEAADTARVMAQAFSESLASNPLITVSLANPAAAPESPVQPRPPLIIAVSIVLGLLAAITLALTLERLRGRVETPADVAEITEAPVVARLPRQRVLQRGPARLIWTEDKMVALQESYRALRTNVEFLVTDKRIIEVTSPAPAQGKSTLVANLGVALGQVGVETVIVDADLRRPTQHAIFGLDNDVGVSSMMALRSPKLDLKPSGFPNLWVITSGPQPPDPTEILHIRFASFAERLRELDALVIMDTPPVLPVSDARLIAPHVDGVLLVIAGGATKPAALSQALERLAFVRADVLGIVLNQSGAEIEAAGGYYYTPTEPAEPADAPVDSSL